MSDAYNLHPERNEEIKFKHGEVRPSLAALIIVDLDDTIGDYDAPHLFERRQEWYDLLVELSGKLDADRLIAKYKLILRY